MIYRMRVKNQQNHQYWYKDGQKVHLIIHITYIFYILLRNITPNALLILFKSCDFGVAVPFS